MGGMTITYFLTSGEFQLRKPPFIRKPPLVMFRSGTRGGFLNKDLRKFWNWISAFSLEIIIYDFKIAQKSCQKAKNFRLRRYEAQKWYNISDFLIYLSKIRAEGADNFCRKTGVYKKTPPPCNVPIWYKGGGGVFLSGIPLIVFLLG